jgi:hypothetical protein
MLILGVAALAGIALIALEAYREEMDRAAHDAAMRKLNAEWAEAKRKAARVYARVSGEDA